MYTTCSHSKGWLFMEYILNSKYFLIFQELFPAIHSYSSRQHIPCSNPSYSQSHCGVTVPIRAIFSTSYYDIVTNRQ